MIGPPVVYPKYGHLEGAWAQGKYDNDQCIVVIDVDKFTLIANDKVTNVISFMYIVGKI